MVDERSGSYRKERIVRLPTTLRWIGKTHEALFEVSDSIRKSLKGVVFWEEPKDQQQFRSKLERDLQILRSEVRLQPKDGRWWFYLGQTLQCLGQTEGAIAAYDECTKINSWNEMAAWAAFRSSRCLVDLGRYDEAIVRCLSGLAIDPVFPELAWMSGWCYLKMRQYDRAIAWSRMATSIGAANGAEIDNVRVGYRDIIGWYDGPLEVLSIALEQVGEVSQLEIAKRDLAAARGQRLQKFPNSRV